MPTKTADLTARERILLKGLASRGEHPEPLSVPDRNEDVARQLRSRGMLRIVDDPPSAPAGFVWVVLTKAGHRAGEEIGASPARHHATKKKSAAQLDREIAQTLAAPRKVAGFARPATRQPGYQIVSVPILKGPRSVGSAGLDSPRERNESIVFSTRAEAEAYLPSVKRYAADFGREAVIKEIW